MTFLNKVKWILAILVIFIVILATNLIDRSNFQRVKDSVVYIYESQLVAKGIILEISIAIQDKEVAVLTKDSSFFKSHNNILNKDLEIFMSNLAETKRTFKEEQIYKELESNLNLLYNAENSFVNNNYVNNKGVLKELTSIKDNLYTLSKIQLDEGSKQMSISKKAIDVMDLFTHMEIYFLIFLAIVIQVIILSNPKKTENQLEEF